MSLQMWVCVCFVNVAVISLLDVVGRFGGRSVLLALHCGQLWAESGRQLQGCQAAMLGRAVLSGQWQCQNKEYIDGVKGKASMIRQHNSSVRRGYDDSVSDGDDNDVMKMAATQLGVCVWERERVQVDVDREKGGYHSKSCMIPLFVLQKVTFEMHSDVGSATYSSVVRSCAENCMDQDDFRQNCSHWLLTTRGCVKRTCCNDEDLCNGAAIPSTHLWCLGPFTALVWLLGTHLL